MNNLPLVSILIPVYNRASIVSRAIDSALSQTYSNIEIIIVDNNSTDSTWDILLKYKQRDSRIKIFKNEQYTDIEHDSGCHEELCRKFSPESVDDQRSCIVGCDGSKHYINKDRFTVGIKNDAYDKENIIAYGPAFYRIVHH